MWPLKDLHDCGYKNIVLDDLLPLTGGNDLDLKQRSQTNKHSQTASSFINTLIRLKLWGETIKSLPLYIIQLLLTSFLFLWARDELFCSVWIQQDEQSACGMDCYQHLQIYYYQQQRKNVKLEVNSFFIGSTLHLNFGWISVPWANRCALGYKKTQNTYPTRNVIYSEKSEKRIFWLKHAAVLTKLMIFGIKVWKKCEQWEATISHICFPPYLPPWTQSSTWLMFNNRERSFNVNEQCVDVREMYWVRMYNINNNTCVGMPVYCVCVCLVFLNEESWWKGTNSNCWRLNTGPCWWSIFD